MAEPARERKTDVVRMELAGAAAGARVTGAEQLPGTANYFIGNDPAKWHAHVPTYAQVRYAGVYPGVDLVYYGNQGQLEYDFVVAPGADAKQVRLRFAGAKKLKLNADGDLEVVAKDGEIAFHRPVVYQVVDGKRRHVEAHFSMLPNHSVGFIVERYDPNHSLVIDPTLAYSTYLGGSQTDYGTSIAIDGEGDAYVTGHTSSNNFPITADSFQNTDPASHYPENVPFVTKINPTGTALIYSTYLGGSSGNDAGSGIAVDSSGAAYVTGQAISDDFPVTSGAFQQTKASGGAAFVSKLDPTGASLSYSTFLSGIDTADEDGNVVGYGIAVDSKGSAYVTGATGNSGYPVTPAAFQPTFINQAGMGFVTKLEPNGSGLAYSTFLGGSILDYCYGIAIDSDNHAYITGATRSPDFPVTAGVFQPTKKSGYSFSSAYITELNTEGSGLIYSSFLGGSRDDIGYSIAVDTPGSAFVTGSTDSYDFPVTPGAFQTYYGAPLTGNYLNAFVTKVALGGGTLAFSTYLGGSNQDAGLSIATDGLENVLLTGYASSNNFPITEDAIQTAIAGQAAFITKMNPNGSALVYSSYFGGNDSTAGDGASGNGIAVDTAGSAYITGYTRESNLLTTPGAFQPSTHALINGANAFISKFAFVAETTISLTPSSTGEKYGQAMNVIASLSGSPAPTGALTYTLDGGTAHSTALSGGSATLNLGILAAGSHALSVNYAGDSIYGSASQTLSFTVAKAVLTVTATSFTRPYGTANPPLTYSYSGFVNGDTSAVIGGSATLTTTATTTSMAGTYPITFATEALTAANYTFTYLPGTLTVTGGSTTCQTIDYSKGFTAAGLSLNGGATVGNNLLQLTDGGFFEARSAFYSTAVPVKDFTTDFTFQLLFPLADGITFTIQSNNHAVIGEAGGGLGYAGIPHSVAVKLDLFNNNGEGFSSTGFYADGSYPSTPAMSLYPAGIDLHSGHIFAVHIAHVDDVTTGTITDTATGKSASMTVPGSISKIVGDSAYVGFTGGTGALTAIQNILSWSYSGGAGCSGK